MAQGAANNSLAPLARSLGHDFADLELLAEALTHRSAASPRTKHGYQRLEFLGDRVLGLIVADMLMTHFPDEDEGALSQRFAELVRKESCAAVAEHLRFADFIRLTPGEAAAGSQHGTGVLGDVCEAVIGAIYCDGGIEAAREFITEQWRAMMEAPGRPPRDAKSALQEWAMSRRLALPAYSAARVSGPDHAPTFRVTVALDGHEPACCEGKNKRSAEQAAAALLLQRLEGDDPGSSGNG